MRLLFVSAFWAPIVLACSSPCATATADEGEPELVGRGARVEEEAADGDEPSWQRGYPWLGEISEEPLPPTAALHEVFPTPDGYERAAAEPDSFPLFLRNLPIRLDREHVLAFDGRRLSSPSAGVVLLDVENRDIQQCATSIIRLHAEYLWSRGLAEKAAYHFTSGDLSRWSDWLEGRRLEVRGDRVKATSAQPAEPNRETWRGYLTQVMIYAGTRSIGRDSISVEPGDIQPGDFYVKPGSPGHAVMVLDIAVNEAGDELALLGQGFMPAQEFHVLRTEGPRVVQDVWFRLPDEENHLDTPSWAPFQRDELRRMQPLPPAK